MPRSKEIEKLVTIVEHHIPMRKTSKLLQLGPKAHEVRRVAAAQQPGASAQQPAASIGGVNLQPAQMDSALQVLQLLLPFLPQGQLKEPVVKISPTKHQQQPRPLQMLPARHEQPSESGAVKPALLALPANDVKGAGCLSRKRKMELDNDEEESIEMTMVACPLPK